MNPAWNMALALMTYTIIAIGSYMMGRMDENKKWAHIWFDQWRSIAQAQIDMENRITAILVATRHQ